MNLSEILGSLKRDLKGKRGYGTPPDSAGFELGFDHWGTICPLG